MDSVFSFTRNSTPSSSLRSRRFKTNFKLQVFLIDPHLTLVGEVGAGLEAKVEEGGEQLKETVTQAVGGGGQ
jgi:hypothetical protein